MKINSAQIKTVKVLKEEEAVRAYGEQGRNGAILVTLVESKNSLALLSTSPIPSLNNPMFVFLIDGKPVSGDEQAIFAKQVLSIINNPALTESVIMITGKEALKKYGENAVNGVLEIYLKKQ